MIEIMGRQSTGGLGSKTKKSPVLTLDAEDTKAPFHKWTL